MRFHKRILMRTNALLRKHVFCNTGFARLVFGARVTSPPDLHSYCEWPTILLRTVVGRYMSAASRVLELGTGAHAVLAVFIKRRWPNADVVATDIVPQRVQCARRTIAASGVDVRCIESDLFGEVDGQYDLVLCNLPQTPTADLEALGYQPVSAGAAGTRLCWSSDGGEDGMAVLRPLLEHCPRYLSDGGRMLMAISPIHVDLNRLRDVVSRSGLRIERVHRLWGINSVYALRAAGGTVSHRCVGQQVV